MSLSVDTDVMLYRRFKPTASGLDPEGEVDIYYD